MFIIYSFAINWRLEINIMNILEKKLLYSNCVWNINQFLYSVCSVFLLDYKYI